MSKDLSSPEKPVWKISQLRELCDLAEYHGRDGLLIFWDRAGSCIVGDS